MISPKDEVMGTDANKTELEALKNALIEMADTSYSHYEAKQKMNVVWAHRLVVILAGAVCNVSEFVLVQTYHG
jgi:hypothetical protein